MMLEKTEDLAKHRLKVAEMMLSQISEEMRQQKRIKEQTFKRVSGEEGREEDGRRMEEGNGVWERRKRRRGVEGREKKEEGSGGEGEGGGWVYMTITLFPSVSVLK